MGEVQGSCKSQCAGSEEAAPTELKLKFKLFKSDVSRDDGDLLRCRCGAIRIDRGVRHNSGEPG